MTVAELIAALEKAERPSRELDAEIAALIAETQPAHPMPDGTIWIEGCGSESSRTLHSRSYTRSIDAALTLVPDGFDWFVSSEFHGTQFFATVTSKDRLHNFVARGILATPAIALCIAALKARGEP